MFRLFSSEPFQKHTLIIPDLHWFRRIHRFVVSSHSQLSNWCTYCVFLCQVVPRDYGSRAGDEDITGSTDATFSAKHHQPNITNNRSVCFYSKQTDSLLVGGLVAIFYFPINIGLLIIPIDEIIFTSLRDKTARTHGNGSRFRWAYVTDPFSPPYEILAIFKNHGKTLYMTLYWASLGPLFNVYLPMLGPCWPYITPCRAHLGSIGRYVRTMLGLCWTQNTP